MIIRFSVLFLVIVLMLNVYGYTLSIGEEKELPPYASPGIYITYRATIPARNGSIIRDIRYEILSIEAVNETMTIRLTVIQNGSILKSDVYEDNIFLPVHFPAIDPRLLTKTHTRPGFLAFQKIVFEDSVVLISDSKTFRTYKYRIVNDPYNTTIYIDVNIGILVKMFDTKGFTMIIKDTNIDINEFIVNTPAKSNETTTEAEETLDVNFMVMALIVISSVLAIIAIIIHKFVKK